MTERSPDFSPPALPTTTPQPKLRKPPPRVAAAIELLLSDPALTIKSAAAKVALSRERLSRALGEDHITAYVQRKAARKVAISSAAAAARMAQLVARAKSENVQFRASEFVLATSGIKPASDATNVNVGVSIGWCLDLRGRTDRPGVRHESGAGVVITPRAEGDGKLIEAKAEPIRGLGSPAAKPAE
jgi:hypothetical protein